MTEPEGAHLVVPTTAFHLSYVDALTEFAAEGRGSASDNSTIGRELREWAARWHEPEVFAAYVDAVVKDALPDSPRPAAHVPQTTLWWVEDDCYLGRIGIRHSLTPFLRDVGGHIGYDVRPSRRREGHATAMLRAALPVAHDLGIDPALITCDIDNLASRKVIESAGGVLEDIRHTDPSGKPKRRYWVAT